MKVGSAFIQTLATQVLQSLASITTGVLIARGLGPTGQGRYATFSAGIAVGALIASLGQFHGNVLTAADRRAPPRVLLARAAVHGTVVLAALSGTVFLGGRLIGSQQTMGLGLLFSLVLSLEAVSEMVRGINLGQHHVTGWNVAAFTQRMAYLAGVGFLAVTAGLRLESVVTFWAIATFISVLVSWGWVWVRSQPEPFRVQDVWAGWGARLGVGIRAFATVGLTLLLVRADVWMLGPMLGVATVGQVSVATYLAEWLWYVPSILGNLLFAVVAADQSTRVVQQLSRGSRLVASLLIPVTIVLLIGGRQLVHALYGPAYSQAGVLFTLLLPGMAALGIHLVVDAYFAGRGFPPITILGACFALVAKVGLNLVAVPLFGAVGAAAVTSVVYVSLLLVKIVWLVRTTGVRWSEVLLLNRSDLAYVRDRIRSVARP